MNELINPPGQDSTVQISGRWPETVLSWQQLGPSFWSVVTSASDVTHAPLHLLGTKKREFTVHIMNN